MGVTEWLVAKVVAWCWRSSSLFSLVKDGLEERGVGIGGTGEIGRSAYLFFLPVARMRIASRG
jgi:hypothetical protein